MMPSKNDSDSPLIGPAWADASFVRQGSSRRGLDLPPLSENDQSKSSPKGGGNYSQSSLNSSSSSSLEASMGSLTSSMKGLFGKAKGALSKNLSKELPAFEEDPVELEKEKKRKARAEMIKQIENDPDALRKFKASVKQSGAITSSGAKNIVSDRVAQAAGAGKR
jgi:hypothetical protein